MLYITRKHLQLGHVVMYPNQAVCIKVVTMYPHPINKMMRIFSAQCGSLQALLNNSDLTFQAIPYHSKDLHKIIILTITCTFIILYMYMYMYLFRLSIMFPFALFCSE